MEPIFRLPPDWTLEVSSVPLAEVIDPFHDFLGVAELQAKTAGKINGRRLRFAVLDTGCDVKHKDLQGQIKDAKDFTGSIFGPSDRQGHGTWCVGSIVAAANDVGVRGIAYEAEVLVAKVLGDSGAGSDSAIAKGLKWAYEQGADVFSLSLGGPGMSDGLHRLFAEISQQKGKFIFCASGNDSGPVNFPAAFDEVIAVGAVDKEGKRTRFTSTGPELDILAPGVEILSTIPGDRYGTMTGTSMACPIAAAIGGLAFADAANNSRGDKLDSLDEMLSLLKKTGRGSDYPLIDPRSLAKQQGLQPPPGSGSMDKIVLYFDGVPHTYVRVP